MTSIRTMTPEEYLALPEDKPYLEYYAGEVCPKPMPNFAHTDIARQIKRVFEAYEGTGGGYTTAEGRTRFGSGHEQYFVLPDVAYYRRGITIRDGQIYLPPTVAVEIVSPDQSLAEQRSKCRRYVENGVEVAWLIEPERRWVEVYEAGREPIMLHDPEDALAPAILPSFLITLGYVFAGLDSGSKAP